ncbi:MAG TPA: polysaccharide biosynthesis/export family protein [Phycisphaerae bacterium]|nr:polysaccharide biosynthesis/export family protein [Phycisphaerae bacterium]
MTGKSSITLTLALLAAVAVVAVGCDEKPPAEKCKEATLPQEFLQKSWEPQELPVAHVLRRDYRLREGDFLEIIYHVRHRTAEAYPIQIEDIIVIRFPFVPQLNQTEQVQSDGNIYLDLIGPVRAVNKTIAEVRQELYDSYLKYLKDPTLTVSFKESKVRIVELQKAITTAPRGQSRLVPITPDGTISLPFVVDIKAAGMTIAELHKALNDAYMAIQVPELEVTVNLQTVSPLRVYVMGEVAKQGPQLNRSGTDSDIGEITLLQAIAQAGGYIPGRAELSSVLLFRRRHLAHPQVAVINVYQLLENRTKGAGKPVVADMSKHRYDIWLEDGDVVYVPTTEIAKRADFIEYVWVKGVRAVCGWTVATDYTAADTVNWLGPN